MFEKDFENRDSLEILSSYNITEIMDNKNMEKIALELWTSQYDVKGNIMTTSSAYKIIAYDSFNKHRDIIGDFFFMNWKYRKLENFEHHLGQFNVWKESMKAKFIMEGLFLAIITFIFQYYLLEATTAAHRVKVQYLIFQNQGGITDGPAFDAFERLALNFYSNMQATIPLSFIAL